MVFFTKKVVLFAALFDCMMPGAFAQGSAASAYSRRWAAYLGFGSSLVDFDGRGTPIATLSALIGVGGKHLAVEAEFGTGLGDVSGPLGVDIGLDYYASGFAVAKAPFGQSSEAFVRAGYAHAGLSGSLGGISASGNDGGAAIGAGLSFANKTIRLDYTYIDSGSGANVFGVHFGREF